MIPYVTIYCFFALIFHLSRMVDAFQGQIASAVENAIANNLEEGVLKLETFLGGLPKEIPVDDIASLNVTLVNDPLISNNSIGFEINGLFTRNEKGKVSTVFHKNSQSLVSCIDSPKMLGISLDEAVFNSASALYYNVSVNIYMESKVQFVYQQLGCRTTCNIPLCYSNWGFE